MGLDGLRGKQVLSAPPSFHPLLSLPSRIELALLMRPEDFSPAQIFPARIQQQEHPQTPDPKTDVVFAFRCDYHIDFAEFQRYQHNLIFFPLYSGRISNLPEPPNQWSGTRFSVQIVPGVRLISWGCALAVLFSVLTWRMCDQPRSKSHVRA